MEQHAPVSLGSPRFQSLSIAGFTVTEAWFPPGYQIGVHAHERACVSIVVDGGFECLYRTRTDVCNAGAVQVKPVGEVHSNRLGHDGARVIILEPDVEADPALAEVVARLAETVRKHDDGGVLAVARTLASEMRSPDRATPLAVQSLALDIAARLCRIAGVAGARTGPPVWLRRAGELLRGRFLEDLDARVVAAEVGVHPTHLARAFTAYYGMPMGAWVRKLRLEWAMELISRNEKPLSEIALEAGFADQSHFTRHFRRQFGMTPGEFRRGA